MVSGFMSAFGEVYFGDGLDGDVCPVEKFLPDAEVYAFQGVLAPFFLHGGDVGAEVANDVVAGFLVQIFPVVLYVACCEAGGVAVPVEGVAEG